MFRAAVVSRRVGSIARVHVRGLAEYKQPPLSQGPGADAGKIADDAEQATGREREELKAFAKGQQYFNREPVYMQKGVLSVGFAKKKLESIANTD